MTQKSRIAACLVAAVALAGCGGGGYRKASRDGSPVAGGAPKVMRMASGPISRACMGSDRKARSPELCGCIQAVANDTLSVADQKLAVSFYSDPHRAQEIRQSDSGGHERFWLAYKDYAETAAAVCG